jgi:translation elongation factor EF-Tu-like GTPase
MIKIKAKIKLFKSDAGRRTPFTNGYRPLFNFITEMKTSGKITLKDRQEFLPGDEGIVEIEFLNKEYLGNDFEKGKKFTFDEGIEILGDGEVLEIIKKE